MFSPINFQMVIYSIKHRRVFLITLYFLTVLEVETLTENPMKSPVTDHNKCSSNQNSCLRKLGSDESVQAAVKYSKRANTDWKIYRMAIENAERQYNATKKLGITKCFNDSASCYKFVIKKDLSIFENGISREMINDSRLKGVLYQIIDGKLYRDKDCKFPARCAGIEHFLIQIINDLPDMEFVINVSDYPQLPLWMDSPGPVFSFSKTENYRDILYPAWSFWDGGPSISIFPTGLGRWDLLRKSIIKAAKSYPWDRKKPQAFFRGSRTSPERDPLILLSRKYPNLVDAQYTKNQAWKTDADTLGAVPASEVKLEEHCQYKYLFNFRGVGASFRFKHLFLCKSLVFHVGDEWKEFFYYLMKPWVHYIPVNKDSSEEELKSLIEFAESNQAIAERIANRGYSFIKTSLSIQHVSYYWKDLLMEYATLINYSIERRNELIRIR